MVAAKALMTDTCEAVRFQAIIALSQVATPGDEKAVSFVCEQLGDKSDFVRSQAMAALSQMLRKSDSCALAVLKARLRDDPALVVVLAKIAN